MEKQNFNTVQELLGYHFHNTMLLQQAFTRRSYTNEHSECENNEVLEFFGDKVLDAVVIRHLAERFGSFKSNGEFQSKYLEGKLTDLKKKLVSKPMLAHRIDVLDLNRYLIMGRGDHKNHIENVDSVKENLFEAILGAMALDRSWNWELIDGIVERMLPIDYYLGEN